MQLWPIQSWPEQGRVGSLSRGKHVGTLGMPAHCRRVYLAQGYAHAYPVCACERGKGVHFKTSPLCTAQCIVELGSMQRDPSPGEQREIRPLSVPEQHLAKQVYRLPVQCAAGLLCTSKYGTIPFLIHHGCGCTYSLQPL